MPDIRIGTSGYSFDDWVGPFYPPKTPSNKMLEYYAQHFDTVEVNFTYYRVPSARTMEAMAKKTPDGFKFIVKAYKGFTHEQDLLQKAAFLEGIRPLEQAGKFSGLLFQFPQNFKNIPQNRRFLATVSQAFRMPVAVEFRDRSWADQAVYDFLASLGLSIVSVDEPEVGTLFPRDGLVSGDLGYVRFHSRNAARWYKGGGERYDYLYSDDELREWLPKLQAIAKRARNIFIYFNNCNAAKAVQNARMMKELIKSAFG